MSLEQNKAVVRRLIEEGLNENNTTVIDEVMAAKFEMIGPGHGRDRFKQVVNSLHTYFGDCKDTIDEMIAEGDSVMVRATRSGTHKGDFPSSIVGTIAPTGNKISFPLVFIFRVQAGKIYQGRSFSDQITLLQQLGAIATPGQARG